MTQKTKLAKAVPTPLRQVMWPLIRGMKISAKYAV